MSKIKQKKQLKKLKKQQRKNEFGFPRTKQLVEIEGSDVGYFLDSSPFLTKAHDMDEVVIVKNKETNVTHTPRFNQLSTMSVSQLVQSTQPVISGEEQEALGFFLDTTPSAPLQKTREKNNIPVNKKKEHKQKIIQDDAVFIEEEEDDDHLSVSSSEDIEIIKSLAHWSKQDMNQLEIDTFQKRRRRSLDAMDYHLLESMRMKDIIVEEREEDLLLTDFNLEQELLHVPSGLIESYKGLVREESHRYNQEKRVYKKKEIDDSNTILDEIIAFIQRQDMTSYDFNLLTVHGRNIIIPKIAKLFQLKMIETRVNSVTLEKTINTCIPASFKSYVNQKQPTQLKTKKRKPTVNQSHHGKEVAMNSAPISSNNIGHRMLSAMGWKEGDSIGHEDGIKEPIKVFMRAHRRGLGA